MPIKPRAPDPFPMFKRYGVPEEIKSLDRDIDAVADQAISDLARAKATTARARSPKLASTYKPADVSFLAYMAVAYRTRSGGVLDEGHLRLLHAALDIRRPSLPAAAAIGLPPVKNLEKFNEAADVYAREPTISDKELAKRVGVDRKSMRLWRKMKQFERRAQGTRISEGVPNQEDRAISAAWDRMYETRTITK